MSEKLMACVATGMAGNYGAAKGPHSSAGLFSRGAPREIALDGELWMGHGQFEETISIVRSETPDDRWKRVRFMVFDAPQAKGTFEQRMQFLQATLAEGNRSSKPLPKSAARERRNSSPNGIAWSAKAAKD